MEENDVNKIKLEQLRNEIQAGIASGDAGTLDANEIKRRGRAWHRAALRETERRYEAGHEQPIDWAVAKQMLRARRGARQ
jgi:hypothetical protein